LNVQRNIHTKENVLHKTRLKLEKAIKYTLTSPCQRVVCTEDALSVMQKFKQNNLIVKKIYSESTCNSAYMSAQ